MTDEGASRTRTASWRRGLPGLISVLLIGAGLIVGLLVALRAPQPPAAPPPAPTVTQPAFPAVATAAPTARITTLPFTPTPAGAASAGDDLAALVNGRPLGRQALETMVAADRAMAQLLGQPPPDGRDVLERLVNGELVWQAAQAAGFVASEAETSAALDAILAAGRASRADLEARLAANGLTFDAFMAYLGRLATVDRFAQRQAQARGETVAAYIGRLQAEARISFGPAAQRAAEAAVAVTPAPTPRSSPPSPTPAATARPTPAPPPVAGRGVEVGQLAPDFTAAVLMRFVTNISYTHNSKISPEDLLGQPAVLSFWTTWCPYCARQTPALVDAYRRYEMQGVRFVGLNVKEEPSVVEAYVEANGIPYPIGLDRDGQIAAAYRVAGFPTTYFLDAGGRIAAKHVGQLSAEQIDVYLSALLAR